MAGVFDETGIICCELKLAVTTLLTNEFAEVVMDDAYGKPLIVKFGKGLTFVNSTEVGVDEVCRTRFDTFEISKGVRLKRN
jgi:hypothetical protein